MKRSLLLIIPAAAMLLFAALAYGQAKGPAATGAVNISDSQFRQTVLYSSAPVVVEFWSPECPHCLRMAKKVDALASDMAGRVKVAKINVLENRWLTREYGVRVVPTFLLFKNGSVAAKASGEMQETELKKELGI